MTNMMNKFVGGPPAALKNLKSLMVIFLCRSEITVGGCCQQTGVPKFTRKMDGRGQMVALSYKDEVIMAREQFSMNN